MILLNRVMILYFHICSQSSSNSCSLTSEQIMSDLNDAPDTDVVFISQPPGVTESGTG